MFLSWRDGSIIRSLVGPKFLVIVGASARKTACAEVVFPRYMSEIPRLQDSEDVHQALLKRKLVAGHQVSKDVLAGKVMNCPDFKTHNVL